MITIKNHLVQQTHQYQKDQEREKISNTERKAKLLIKIRIKIRKHLVQQTPQNQKDQETRKRT